MAAEEYELLVAQTRTGDVVDSLPAASSQWRFTENLAWAEHGKLDLTVPLPGKDEAGQIVRSTLRSLAAGMSALSIAVVRDGVALWAGPVTTLRWSGQSVSVGCASLSWLFDRRVVVAAGYEDDPSNPLADLTLNLSPRDLVIELLDRATTGSRRDLPLTLPAQSGGAGSPVVYRGPDLRTTYESIKVVSEADGGPDVVLQPAITDDRSTISWSAVVGDPDLGGINPAAVWDYPQVVLSGDLDESETVTTAYAVGDAPDGYSGEDDRQRLVGVSVTDRGDPWPALERADRTTVSEARPEQLAALAASYGKQYAWAVEEATFTTPTGFGPDYRTAWNLGDTGRFAISEHPWLDDTTSSRRITAVSVSARELDITALGERLTGRGVYG